MTLSGKHRSVLCAVSKDETMTGEAYYAMQAVGVVGEETVTLFRYIVIAGGKRCCSVTTGGAYRNVSDERLQQDALWKAAYSDECDALMEREP
jgi:hypothetical protein